MKPIVLIHGYSSEGKDASLNDIYGTLPDELRKWAGAKNVRELNLSRWISLNDGITLDDVSLAMDRALNTEHPDLPASGFHVIIHSTGALVARNWIKKFSPKPCPILNLVHLAGANFGSGMAHIGRGQLSRWGRHLAVGTGCGFRILNELEFGASKTLDLHLYFLREGTRILEDYKVQEYCVIGSQIPEMMRLLPIRYVKEDSSDCTVRTSGCNLNFNYISIQPKPKSFALTQEKHLKLVECRLDGKRVLDTNYEISNMSLSGDSGRAEIPFAISYETAHFGDKIGIVTGSQNRRDIMPLIKAALETPLDPGAYAAARDVFAKATTDTFNRAAALETQLTEWNPQEQYEGHAQLIFRLRDQHGDPVEYFDIYLNSKPQNNAQVKLESLIEDKHLTVNYKGVITFYLRTQKYIKKNRRWNEQLKNAAPLDLEITGHEPLSGDISYAPVNIRMTPEEVRVAVKSFQTTVIDVTLLRLPSPKVFEIRKTAI